MREDFYCYCPVCGELIYMCSDLNYEVHCPDCGWLGFAYQTDYIKQYDEYYYEEDEDPEEMDE